MQVWAFYLPLPWFSLGWSGLCVPFPPELGLVVVLRTWGMQTKVWSKECCGGTLSQTIAHCTHQVIFVHASCWRV